MRETPKSRSWWAISAGHVVVAGMSLLMLLVLHAYPLWRPYTHGVVTAEWPLVLWAADLSLLVQCAGHLVLALFRPRLVRRLAELVFSALGLISLAVFVAIYPLDFSRVVGPDFDALVRLGLAIAVLAVGLAVLVNLLRTLFWWWSSDDSAAAH